MHESLLISEVAVARALSLRTPELRRLADRGQIPCRLLPSGAKRFDPREVREWVDRLRHIEPVPA